MNRLLTLATVSLLAVPATARAQFRAEDLVRANAKVSAINHSTLGDLADWNAYNRAGWRAFNKGYYDTAEHEFYAAIKAAKRPSLDDPRLLARSYADYALAIQKQGRYAEAEPLEKWALTVRETLLGGDSPAYAQSLNQLATLYYELGRFAESEPLLRRAAEAQGRAPKTDPREHSRTHSLFGLQLVAQRRYAEAEPSFLKVVQICEKWLGPSHPDTGDGLNNLAWAYHEQGKDDEARPLFERALKIYLPTRGSVHPSVAYILDGLAEIDAANGDYDRAEVEFRRAIAIWEKIPNAGASELARVLRRYARLLESSGRRAETESVKARLDSLPVKVTMADRKASSWYRSPEPSQGIDLGPARRRS
jgi:tetratricopeptide (TPR) repeat protein